MDWAGPSTSSAFGAGNVPHVPSSGNSVTTGANLPPPPRFRHKKVEATASWKTMSRHSAYPRVPHFIIRHCFCDLFLLTGFKQTRNFVQGLLSTSNREAVSGKVSVRANSCTLAADPFTRLPGVHNAAPLTCSPNNGHSWVAAERLVSSSSAGLAFVSNGPSPRER